MIAVLCFAKQQIYDNGDRMEKRFLRTKRGCHCANTVMASVFSLPPMLFLTFHELYGISYTLLGTLVLVDFCTQFFVDLVFTLFSRFFNIKLTVRVMPLLTTLGLVLYALAPELFRDNVYLGLVLGTVVFSVASGLCEVLLSPLIAAIPGATDKDMSALHSLYGIGVVAVVGVSSVFFAVIGREYWQYLALFWAALPIVPSVLLCLSPFPEMKPSHEKSSQKGNGEKWGLFLCVACIFLGSAAENTMSNWISSYMESALGITKTVGDLLGMAMFAALLTLGRILYTRFGKDIGRLLLISMAGASVCYLLAGLASNVLLSFFACILTGLCVSMLWPGSLIFMEEKLPGVGVAGYALMAAGGDFGASVAPQLLGSIVDRVSAAPWAAALSGSPEQLGMKAGMVMAAVFPILGTALLLYMRKYFGKE